MRDEIRARGFTFVELLVVSVLFLVIMSALITIFLTGRSSYLSTSAYIQVQQEARRAFDPIVREIRESRISAAAPTTALANGAVQLNFQIARGYNLNASDPNCPVNDVCWGSDLAANGWVHYSIIDSGNPNNPFQLIRCADTSESLAITAMGAGCRVLANYVRHPNAANSAAFAYDGVNRMVTANLQFEYAEPTLPAGRLTMPLMSGRIRLRN
jgi:prepilin-type N-terminal cleavage/methylation domain-containing protein